MSKGQPVNLRYSDVRELTREQLLAIMDELPEHLRPAGRTKQALVDALWHAISITFGKTSRRLQHLVRSAPPRAPRGREGDIFTKGRRLPGSAHSRQ